MKGKKLITIISIVCILVVMLCVPAFATVTESDGNGYALYDGVKLPALPSVDGYTYATIDYSGLSNDGSVSSATLWLSTMTLYRSTANNGISTVFKSSEAGFVSKYDLVIDGNSSSWSLSTNRDYGANVMVINLNFVDWSNYDIFAIGLNGVDDGTLYLFGSSSISLAGYSLISWDGDTSNLEMTDSGYVKVADYVSAISAFAYVVNGNDFMIVDGFSMQQTPFDIWSLSVDGLSVVVSASDDITGSSAVNVSRGTWVLDLGDEGITLYIAYRTTEAPPDEGGGDDPDDPQPPLGG